MPNRHNILLNGIGCPIGGGRAVLQHLLNNVPSKIDVRAILPYVKKLGKFETPGNVKSSYFNHNLWGMYLRPFLEIQNNLGMIFNKYDCIINISNYGLCFTHHQLLYIHNPFILDLNSIKHFGGGHPNFLNRYALKTYLKNAECIILQTDHMFNNLVEFCDICNIPLPKNVKILKPYPIIYNDFSKIIKPFKFSFFYPTTNFPHKQTDLAINSIIYANKFNKDIGLSITKKTNIDLKGVKFLGRIQPREVCSWFDASEALIFTSTRETLGLPLLEALYFGKPAVLPDLPYAREIYGEAAVYYKGNQPKNVCKAILELMNNYNYYILKASERKKIEWSYRKSWTESWKIMLNCFNIK